MTNVFGLVKEKLVTPVNDSLKRQYSERIQYSNVNPTLLWVWVVRGWINMIHPAGMYDLYGM